MYSSTVVLSLMKRILGTLYHNHEFPVGELNVWFSRLMMLWCAEGGLYWLGIHCKTICLNTGAWWTLYDQTTSELRQSLPTCLSGQ